jgi:hypothetical protein
MFSVPPGILVAESVDFPSVLNHGFARLRYLLIRRTLLSVPQLSERIAGFLARPFGDIDSIALKN